MTAYPRTVRINDELSIFYRRPNAALQETVYICGSHGVTTIQHEFEKADSVMRVGALHGKDSSKPSRLNLSVSSRRFAAFIYLVIIDITCLIIGFGAAVYSREIFIGKVEWELAVAALIPVYFIAALGMHAYDRVCLQNARQASMRGAKSAIVAVGTMLLIAFTLQSSEELSRLVILPGAIVAALLIATCRYIFVRNLWVLVGGSPFSVILLWDGTIPLPQESFSAIVEIGTDFDPERHDPVMYDRFAKTVAGADRIVVACAAECRPAWAHLLKSSNIQGEVFVPELLAIDPIGVSVHGRMPSVIVAVGPLGLTDRLIKRLFDIVVSLTALLMFAPLLLVISILIKLDSPGDVLFKQVRIGRRNEMFLIWKFRSMRMERGDEGGNRSASRDDDRLTRIGSLIRKTSIDELPQLFNVLKGDMSIVGPRPHALGSRAAEKLFWEVDGRYWHRHSVKPGLTGLAQVRGFRGATVEESDLRNRLQADLEYLEAWSIWRDIKIITLTLRVLFHTNAY